ncbi:hypothetical protein U9M48_034581 [Paspalum notatum var. saurae]|uniref:MULE transposase domain-containing protein n=1 Tax=Paspalum notatum var. saurae TaxID=547442 RepID=A0AAQ3U9B2_PASNO
MYAVVPPSLLERRHATPSLLSRSLLSSAHPNSPDLPRLVLVGGRQAQAVRSKKSTPTWIVNGLISRGMLDSEPELRLVIHEACPEQEEAVEAIDWDTLQILDSQDEEDRLEIIDDDQMDALLGLREEDENAEKARFLGQGDKESNQGNVEDDTLGAAIPVSDEIPEERVVVHDPDKPCMDLGTVYPDWQPDGRTIMVTVLVGEHSSTSKCQKEDQNTYMCLGCFKGCPGTNKEEGNGTKELRNFLQDKYKCEIHYDMAWKGRQKAMKELYGYWEQSFQMLYNWRAEVLKRSPDSVIEIDVKEVDGKVYFHSFFRALRPCIDGFKEGCRPYLSIDSSALNGRWNEHIASAAAIDGHNSIYPIAFGFKDGETEENWTWFMTQLKNGLGEMPVLAVCTDACKGLEKSVKAVFPHAEQRECFRHLMHNFMKRYGGDVFSKMYTAARIYRKRVFGYFFNQVVEASNDAKVWLDKHHKLKWMRCELNPDIKCDYMAEVVGGFGPSSSQGRLCCHSRRGPCCLSRGTCLLWDRRFAPKKLDPQNAKNHQS